MADIAATNWNEVDASNTAAAPDGAVEGMAPSGVNNVLRAHQGAIKRMWKRNSVMATTGAAGAYLVTHTVPPAALADGETELVSFHVANTAGATLNVGGLGDKPLHYYSAGAWRLVPAGLIGTDQTMRVAYHASSSAYRLLDLPDRTGEVVTWAGPNAPAGSLLCYGQAISRTAYAGLRAVLGDAHGVGDGSSTFNVPDLRGRVAAGKGDMGGSESGRLNEYVASVLGAAGGVPETDFAVTGSITGGVISGTAFTNGLATTAVTGGSPTQQAANAAGMDLSGNAHTHTVVGNASVSGGCTASVSGATDVRGIVQPTMTLNYIIRI